MWIARDRDGGLYIYANEPTRSEYGFFYSEGDGEFLPNVFYPEVTWENSPKELVVKED